jgi:hypothetical protein
VGDFAAVAIRLRQAGMITDDRNGRHVTLADGIATDKIVKYLVEQGIAVYEVAHEEETLEDVYLSLMTETKNEQESEIRNPKPERSPKFE